MLRVLRGSAWAVTVSWAWMSFLRAVSCREVTSHVGLMSGLSGALLQTGLGVSRCCQRPAMKEQLVSPVAMAMHSYPGMANEVSFSGIKLVSGHFWTNSVISPK